MTLQVNSQTNIPNADFEQWTTSTTANNWSTDITGNISMGGFPISLSLHFGTRTLDSHSGTYAMKIQGNNFSLLTEEYIIPGICQLGQIGEVDLDMTAITALLEMDFQNLDIASLQTLASLGNLFSKGIPFNEIPTKLKAYIKFFPDPDSSDSLSIYAYTTKWNSLTNTREMVSMGTFSSGLVNSYSQITLYMDTLIDNVTPDSISVIFFTGAFNSSLATELYIDDITLEYTPNPVGIETNSDFQLSVFPNPSINYIKVIPSVRDLPYSVALIDMNGKIIMHEDNMIQEEILDISTFAKGLYLIKVIQANNVAIRKIVIE
jgi:hypothetical protein